MDRCDGRGADGTREVIGLEGTALKTKAAREFPRRFV